LTVYRDERGKIVFIRHDKKKDHTGAVVEGEKKDEGANKDKDKEGVEVEKVVELKKGALDGNVEDDKAKKFADEENVAEAFLSPDKKKSKKGGDTSSKLLSGSSTAKKFKDDEDNVAEVVKGSSSKKSSKNGPSNNEDEELTGEGKKKKAETAGYYNEYGEWVEGGGDADGENNYGEEEEQEEEEEKEEDLEAIEAKKKAENDIFE
jgi:hypothetical protein